MIVRKMKRVIRHKRIRKRVWGASNAPRLAVFRSNKHVYAQIVDDSAHKTIVSASDVQEKKSNEKMNRVEKAFEIGLKIAEAASGKKIKKVVFDRGGYKYHGRIKALAEGARKGGLSF